MDPQFMLDLQDANTPIGTAPMDWRHPAAHALYWSAKGVDVGFNLRGRTDSGIRHIEKPDMLNTDRQVLHALQRLAHQGVVVFSPDTGRPPTFMPSTEFIQQYHKWWEKASARVAREDVKGSESSFHAGHENFLQWATAILWMRGEEEKAEEMFLDAKELYENEPHNQVSAYRPVATYAVEDLDEFTREYFRENAELRDNAEGYVLLALVEGYASLAEGKVRGYLRNRELAQIAHERYMQGRRETANTEVGRMQLLPLDELERYVFTSFLRGMPGMREFTLAERSLAWNTARTQRPADLPPLVEPIYPVVQRELAPECKKAGLDVFDVFPPPLTPNS
jgi:hypothetical protein